MFSSELESQVDYETKKMKQKNFFSNDIIVISFYILSALKY